MPNLPASAWGRRCLTDLTALGVGDAYHIFQCLGKEMPNRLPVLEDEMPVIHVSAWGRKCLTDLTVLQVGDAEAAVAEVRAAGTSLVEAAFLVLVRASELDTDRIISVGPVVRADPCSWTTWWRFIAVSPMQRNFYQQDSVLGFVSQLFAESSHQNRFAYRRYGWIALDYNMRRWANKYFKIIFLQLLCLRNF